MCASREALQEAMVGSANEALETPISTFSKFSGDGIQVGHRLGASHRQAISDPSLLRNRMMAWQGLAQAACCVDRKGADNDFKLGPGP